MGIQPACAEANAAPKPLLSCDEMVYPPIPHAYSKADVNGVTYLYAGGNLHRNFSLSANLTLPKIPTNRALFYADWLMLIPRARSKNLPFVQINLLRWRRFAYRPEVSYTWAAPDGTLIYADSKIFLEDSKVHRFGIAVRGSALRMSLDGRDICRARTADFIGSKSVPARSPDAAS